MKVCRSRILKHVLPVQRLFIYSVAGGNDPYIKLAEDSMTLSTKLALPGAYLVNVIPWCEQPRTLELLFLRDLFIPSAVKYIPAWFPGAQFRRDANECKKIGTESLWRAFNMVKRQVRRSTIYMPDGGFEIMVAR